jgi:hypothetical protein
LKLSRVVTVDSRVTPCAINHPTDSPYFNKIAAATLGHGKITSKQVKMAPGTRSGRLSAISAHRLSYQAPHIRRILRRPD